MNSLEHPLSRFIRWQSNQIHNQIMNIGQNMNLTKLKINIKSLAAEAQINRKEAKKVRGWDRYDLNAHRTGHLRQEARRAHLAYAFLRGKPYKEVEPIRKTSTKYLDSYGICKELTEKINRFSSKEVFKSEVAEWLKQG